MAEIQERLHWEAVSQYYLEHRPGYPQQFFALLQQLGVGLAGQDILDLGSGTGALAVPFALRGARVTAVDLSEQQILAGREAARRHGANIAFAVAPAEETGLPDHSFDVVTASMCWGYFDVERMTAEIPRLLRNPGLLLIATLIWTGREDPIASHTDELIYKYNAESRAARSAEFEVVPAWSKGKFLLKTYHDYHVDLPFTRESWRGRIRATKWIGAALPAGQTEAFDREHESLLERVAPPAFSIRHRICLQVFESFRAG